MRIQAEERLAEEVRSRLEADQSRSEIASQLDQERSQREALADQLAQTPQTIALNLLRQGVAIEVITAATGLSIGQLQELAK
jgi:predicted RNase H-like nuclease (RuvC/YqgF family)